MDELIRSFRTFIGRDLIYLLSGAMVLSAFLYIFYPVQLDASNLLPVFLVIGISYVLGYVIQHLFCAIGIVTVWRYHSPSRFIKWLYRQLLGEEWIEIDTSRKGMNERHIIVHEKGSKRSLNEIERFITHKELSSCVAPACILAAIPLLYSYFGNPSGQSHLLSLAIFLIVIAAILIPLNWLKSAQQSQYVFSLSERLFANNKSDKGMDKSIPNDETLVEADIPPKKPNN